MIDYGAIALKNGKLISEDIFTPMVKTVGFSDWDENMSDKEKSQTFDRNYFVVIGNKDIQIGFYKTLMTWKAKYADIDEEYQEVFSDTVCFGNENYRKWKYWEDYLPCNSKVTIKVRPRYKYDYFVADIKIDDDVYKVYFGYGVDLDFYKKTGRVNYYNSIEYKFSKLKRNLKLWLNLRFGIEFKN